MPLARARQTDASGSVSMHQNTYFGTIGFDGRTVVVFRAYDEPAQALTPCR